MRSLRAVACPSPIRPRRGLGAAALLAATLAACGAPLTGDDGGTLDASRASDARAPGRDGAPSGPDASPPADDAGTTGPDGAGTPDVVTTRPPADPAAPVVFFVDVEAGPTRGGPGGLGAPISIFGHGFGATRGGSTVTIGGHEVASYMVWGANNAHHPVLDMIVVQPGAGVTAGPIVVTVGGRASNADVTFTPNTGSVYYVAPAGADSAACSESAPCATIQHAVDDVMHPGDVLLVRGGDLREGEIWIRDDQGDSGAPGAAKVVRNYPGEEVRLVDATRPVIVDANYITFSGLNFLNGTSLGLGTEMNHHNRAINNTFAGQISWDAIDAHGDGHVIAGNYCDLAGSAVGTEGHCYYVSAGSHTQLRYNFASGQPGYGIHVYDEQRATPDIRRLISDVLVEGNVLRGSRQRSGMIVAMADQAGLGNAIDGVTIRNNVFVENNHAGLVIEGISRNVHVYHNTFSRNGRQGVSVARDQVAAVDVVDNLIDQTANTVCQVDCSFFETAHIEVESGATGVTVDHNLYMPAPARVLGATDAAAVAGTVTFRDAAHYDYRLGAGAVAIDRGRALPAVLTDFNGVGRPQGAAPDLGAFEFVAP